MAMDDNTTSLATKAKGISGELAIVAVVCIGVGAAAAGMLYNHYSQDQALQLWGPDAAARILGAPTAELGRLELDDPSAGGGQGRTARSALEKPRLDLMTLGGRAYRSAGWRNVATAPGFSHVRRSLVNDRGFGPPSDQPFASYEWIYTLRFKDDEGQCALVFTADATQVALVSSGRLPRMATLRASAPGIAGFFREQIPE